jgi:hypothetical protein
LRRKPDADKLDLACRERQTQSVISMPASADDAQEAKQSQVGSGRQGSEDSGSHVPDGRGRRLSQEARRIQVLSSRQRSSDAGSHVPDDRGRHLRRTPDAIKLAVAGRKPQTQADISRPAGADVCQGSQTHSCCLRQAGNRRLRQLRSGRQVQTLLKNTESVKLALAVRQPQAQAVMSRPAGT